MKTVLILAIILMSADVYAASLPQDSARLLDVMIAAKYAYMDKLPGHTLPKSLKLDAERDGVTDDRSLLRYAEDRMASLADHHAITGGSFADSWAIVPTYADLWIVEQHGNYVIDAVRDDSPAARAGVKRGERLACVDGVEAGRAVIEFWRHLGLDVTPARAAYAARVLAAGRRDRPRHLGIADLSGAIRQLTLPSLYSESVQHTPLSVEHDGTTTVVKINNSLGDEGTIPAFDRLMAKVPSDGNLVLDLRETPSGGNTTVARAIMGWFVSRATSYQIHNRPEEERETGIEHQWIEQVLPRTGKFHARLPVIFAGRWTGSMGEGLAIGFAAFGASVQGGPMAGLNGSVEDLAVGTTGITIKLPTERLMTTWGLPREDFTPRAKQDR